MIQISKYLQTNKKSFNPYPMLNSLFGYNFSIFGSFDKDNAYKTYMKWARKSPQLMGFLNIISADILSDKILFEPLNKNDSGRNKVMRAENFWKFNQGRDIAEETIYDMLLNGVGYNWVGKLDEGELKEFCRKSVAMIYEGKELEFKSKQMYEGVKPLIVRKLRFLPASTVSIRNDEYEIKEFIQKVGVHTKIFAPEEIIMYKFMPLDGKVYPFPPMEALLSEVYLLHLISQNYVSFFENGGSPDKVFVLPKELAGSNNHKYLIETLKKYKKIQNKHGNLVFTGDIKIEDLQQVESKMENKDLGLYLVGVLAMMYGVPAGRIPFLIGKAANLGDAGGLADSGYWRKISVWQSKIEEALNMGVFNPYFGVNIKFARGYKQDEVRETQVTMQKTQVAEQRIRMGLWTVEEAGRFLGIDSEVVEEAQKELEERQKKEMDLNSKMLNKNLNSNSNVINEPDKNLKNKKKQTKQNKHQFDEGGKKINP